MSYCKGSAGRLITQRRDGIMGTVTDAQMMTLALAAIIPVSMLIYSNSRITEAKEALRSEMNALDGNEGRFRENVKRNQGCARRSEDSRTGTSSQVTIDL
jgi:hypothetical protein